MEWHQKQNSWWLSCTFLGKNPHNFVKYYLIFFKKGLFYAKCYPAVLWEIFLMLRSVGPNIVGTPAPFLQGKGLSLQPNFQKGGLDRTSTFRGGLLGKRGWLFSRGRLQFSHKNKLKSEIFNDKQFISKNIFLCHN